jgi:leucyl aminopeptidase
MKSDMGGAAATFGAMEAAARLQLPVHLIGIVPSTDNSVDALSYKPSDVVTGHSGKTIEIIDTDAEGRLVMSDGLSYATKYFKPEVLIDIATLTGSAVRTFGYECAAIMSKNEELVSSFRAAGDACGERVWPLPVWDEYMAGLNSDVADIKNYSGRPVNGAIDAFKFLEFFTEDHPAFIHFDIAGVAIKAGPYAKDRQATGFGMRLFVEWLERR